MNSKLTSKPTLLILQCANFFKTRILFRNKIGDMSQSSSSLKRRLNSTAPLTTLITPLHQEQHDPRQSILLTDLTFLLLLTCHHSVLAALLPALSHFLCCSLTAILHIKGVHAGEIDGQRFKRC